MSESDQAFRDFEAQLVRQFNEPPAFPDADVFARSVEQRLDSGWRVRSLVIGVAGLFGGVIGLSQVMASNLVGQVEALSFAQNRQVMQSLGRMIPTHLALPSLPFGGEALWMSAGLAAAALAFALTRALEEI